MDNTLLVNMYGQPNRLRTSCKTLSASNFNNLRRKLTVTPSWVLGEVLEHLTVSYKIPFVNWLLSCTLITTNCYMLELYYFCYEFMYKYSLYSYACEYEKLIRILTCTLNAAIIVKNEYLRGKDFFKIHSSSNTCKAYICDFNHHALHTNTFHAQ